MFGFTRKERFLSHIHKLHIRLSQSLIQTNKQSIYSLNQSLLDKNVDVAIKVAHLDRVRHILEDIHTLIKDALKLYDSAYLNPNAKEELKQLDAIIVKFKQINNINLIRITKQQQEHIDHIDSLIKTLKGVNMRLEKAVQLEHEAMKKRLQKPLLIATMIAQLAGNIAYAQNTGIDNPGYKATADDRVMYQQQDQQNGKPTYNNSQTNKDGERITITNLGTGASITADKNSTYVIDGATGNYHSSSDPHAQINPGNRSSYGSPKSKSHEEALAKAKEEHRLKQEQLKQQSTQVKQHIKEPAYMKTFNEAITLYETGNKDKAAQKFEQCILDDVKCFDDFVKLMNTYNDSNAAKVSRKVIKHISNITKENSNYDIVRRYL